MPEGLLERLGLRKQDGESLDRKQERVREAWRDVTHDSGPAYENVSYVVEVFEDRAIVCHGDDYFSVPYSEADGEVTFDVESATPVERTWTETAKTVRITKSDDETQTVFGWAYVSEDAQGVQVVDHSDEWISKEDLEIAAYEFTLNSREGDERHTEEVKAHLVESFVPTPEKMEAMGLAKDALPAGWWVGFYIPDSEVYAKVRDGEYRAFSIGGHAKKVAA